jgi:HAD superfamily hydrolase (TIGR01509 family)
MSLPDLVIFDCDGVLIDSEMLSCKSLHAALGEYGVAATLEEIMRRCIGHSEAHTVADIQACYGVTLPPEYILRKRQLTAQVFEESLNAMAGVSEFVGKLPMKKCIASGSTIERLQHSLGLVGLWDIFTPHIFSATQVRNGKPAPDLFLFAAEQMGVDPKNCLVVEDSVAGVRAAKAAHMRVFGFTGGEHCDVEHEIRLLAEGAEAVYGHMDDIAKVLGLDRYDKKEVAHAY